MARQSKTSVRITTSVAAEVAEKLETIARTRKVSKSWAIARAIEDYVARATGTDNKAGEARGTRRARVS